MPNLIDKLFSNKLEIPHLTEVFNASNIIKKNIEKTQLFYISPKQTEQIKKKWLNVEAVMNG